MSKPTWFTPIKAEDAKTPYYYPTDDMIEEQKKKSLVNPLFLNMRFLITQIFYQQLTDLIKKVREGQVVLVSIT